MPNVAACNSLSFEEDELRGTGKSADEGRLERDDQVPDGVYDQ